MSAKQAIGGKLQGSVATYLRCGGVVNNQIEKGLLLSLRVKTILKSVNIWQSYSKNVIVLCTFSVFEQCVGQAHKVHETITQIRTDSRRVRLYFKSISHW